MRSWGAVSLDARAGKHCTCTDRGIDILEYIKSKGGPLLPQLHGGKDTFYDPQEDTSQKTRSVFWAAMTVTAVPASCSSCRRMPENGSKIAGKRSARRPLGRLRCGSQRQEGLR